MFQRDKELRTGDRARVLEKAREQREARARQREKDTAARRVHFAVRMLWRVRRQRAVERQDFDAKVGDVTRLKAILQRERMPLPYDLLFTLLRQLLFFYSGRDEDQKRLTQLAGLFRDTLVEAATSGGDGDDAFCNAALNGRAEVTRKWQLRRLVELCLQVASACAETALALTRQLQGSCPWLLSTARDDGRCLHRFSPIVWAYSDMPSCTLAELTRGILLTTRELLSQYRSRRLSTQKDVDGSSGDASSLLAFTIDVMIRSGSSTLRNGFVEQVLSVPLLYELVRDPNELSTALCGFPLWDQLITAVRSSSLQLPPTPVVGIASVTWLLGNLLWLVDRAGERSGTEAVLLEVEMLTHLLRVVPTETFAANGVAVSWTKVSESHSVPVVYPDALNNQLRLLLKDKYLRLLCSHLLRFTPSALTHPLATDRPMPMHPNASAIAEQFGFGDIASPRSALLSFSGTWERVRTLGRAQWANKLLERAGLKKRRDSSATADDGSGNARQPRADPRTRDATSALRDTSLESRTLATSGSALLLGKWSGAKSPFNRDHTYALAQFCTTFLFRWSQGESPLAASSNPHPMGMALLNLLSFYQFAVDESDETGDNAERINVHFVRFLWSVLQDVKNFEDVMKTTDLLRAKPTDGYMATFALFCATYSHLLFVLDDEEMYELELPLPLHQLERLVVGLKHALHAAYWVYGSLDAGQAENPGTLAFGMFVVGTATRLLGDLYNRCSRLPFCNVTSWVIPGLDSARLIDEVLAGTPRANKLISSMPYVVSFPERVKLFQRLVAADRALHRGDATNALRVRIRRSAILEDGLAKLNSIRGSLKKKINVIFVNAAGREEVGIDAGGLFKEFWLDLASLAFDLQYGLFLTTPTDQLLYPNPNAASAHFTRESDHLTLFQFVGRILGKALYEGIVVEPKFAHFFLSKLLHTYNHLHELPSLDPEIYKNLMFLKAYEGDVEDLGLTFTVVHDSFGQPQEVELIANGANVSVTSYNKTRYIHLVANYYLNTQIRAQSAAFRAGLADLIDPRWLVMFNEPELQVLISGKSGQIDINDLRAHTVYGDGYYGMDKRVQWLWRALESFSPSERAAFLRFATSCQRAPSLGFASLQPPFCVRKIPIRHDDELLPSSSTCFNTLKLPTYGSYKTLRAKLLLSISSGAGFEMT